MSENTNGGQAEPRRPLAEMLKALLAEGAERSKEISSGGSLTGVLQAINEASRQDLELVALFAITGFVREEADATAASEADAQAAFDGWIEGGGTGASDLEKFSRRAVPVQSTRGQARPKK